MKIVTCFAALIVLAAAAPLAAKDGDASQDGSGSTQATPGSAPGEGGTDSNIVVEGQQDKPERVICKRVIPTGSIRSIRVCQTESEAKEREQQGSQTITELQDRQRIQDNVRRNRDAGL